MKFPELGLNSPQRLRDLIRSVRSARTAAEERGIAQKESAAIRDNFRREVNVWRCRNVAKLLYLYMLGYPAHFGQMECLKLIASSTFTDKRIGYLGVTLLLDERQDIHMLITNSLKNDLSHANNYVIGMALSTLAAICSPQMGNDLASEVERLVRANNLYLKKKAILCAVRIVNKVPQTCEIFIGCIKSLLLDKNQSVVSNGITLLDEIVKMQPSYTDIAIKLLPQTLRSLRSVLVGVCNSDCDIGGVGDPFLQSAVLRLIQRIGHFEGDVSLTVKEVLAQIATNTEGTKNVGNAILYGTVLAIISTKSDSALRLLAVNILGRFLINTDKNVRYVALSTMLKMVSSDMIAVQKHRATIAECLQDFDPSVKRRAMELTFAITDSHNIAVSMENLCAFLKTCEPELKTECTASMFVCIEKFSKNRKWQIDQSIEILRIAGNYICEYLVSNLVSMISSAGEYRSTACRALYRCILDDQSQQPLCYVACWCLGEFADTLLSPDDHDVSGSSSDFFSNDTISGRELTNVMALLLKSPVTSNTTKGYSMNALMKISTLPLSADVMKDIEELTNQFRRSHNLELQTRSSEYHTILSSHNNLRLDIFDRVPMFVAVNGVTLKLTNDTTLVGEDWIVDSTNKTNGVAPVDTDDDLDMLLNFGVESQTKSKLTPAGANMSNDLDNLFSDDIDVHQMPASECREPLASQIVDQDGLKLYMTVDKSNADKICISITAWNITTSDFKSFLLQAAVPKSYKLTMLPASSNRVPAMEASCLDQKMFIETIATNTKQPKLRFRISFTTESGQHITHQQDVSVL